MSTNFRGKRLRSLSSSSEGSSPGLLDTENDSRLLDAGYDSDPLDAENDFGLMDTGNGSGFLDVESARALLDDDAKPSLLETRTMKALVEGLQKILNIKDVAVDKVLLENTTLKRSKKYVSSVEIEQHFGDFEFDKDKQELELWAETNLPDGLNESEFNTFCDKWNNMSLLQKQIFVYLKKKHDVLIGSMPSECDFYGLPEKYWVHRLLVAVSQIHCQFAESCCGHSDLKARPNISIVDNRGQKHNMTTARFLAGLLYGFNCLFGRHASHLCGNGSCLNPAHIYPEEAAINLSRDNCHYNGYVSAPDCSHMPLCLPSLKLGQKTAKHLEGVEQHLLVAENFVKNSKWTENCPLPEKAVNGWNIVFADHEYNIKSRHLGSSYLCKHNFLLGCNGKIYVTGLLSLGTLAAFETVPHLNDCQTVSEETVSWIESSILIVESMWRRTSKTDKDKITGIEIGGFNYNASSKYTWKCTITGCKAKCQVKSGRYRLMGTHNCKADQETVSWIESSLPITDNMWRKKKDKITGITVDGFKYSKIPSSANWPCTVDKCTAKCYVKNDRYKLVDGPHTCTKKADRDAQKTVSWLEESTPIVESMWRRTSKTDKDKINGIEIGGFKYSNSSNCANWPCTIDKCTAKCRVQDGRYKLLGTHSCKADRETVSWLESSIPIVESMWRKKDGNIIGIEVDGFKYYNKTKYSWPCTITRCKSKCQVRDGRYKVMGTHTCKKSKKNN